MGKVGFLDPVDFISGKFAYKAPTPTGINNVQESESAEKFIRNGQLYIRQSGCVYDAQGRLVFDF